MTWRCGAAASQVFIAPHSSASTWPKLIQRSDSMGMTLATASAISGNRPRMPGVEQQRLLADDEELVEREPVRADRPA